MNSNERRRYETLVRIREFGLENAADFPAGSAGAAQFAAIAAAIDNIEAATADKQAGFGEAAQQFEVKDTARENLRDEITAIARTARGLEYRFTGISNKFHFNRNMSGAVMLASARAFAALAVEYEPEFITYGLTETFIADLTSAADAFEAAFGAAESAATEHITATAEVAGYVRNGMIAKRVLDSIVRNRYADSIGKLTGWASVSHVEREPRRRVQINPPPGPQIGAEAV